MRRSIALACAVSGCALLAQSCGEGQETPVDAFYAVKDAVEDGRAKDVIDGFTERGKRHLALYCLFEAMAERVREPIVEGFQDAFGSTGREPLDLGFREMHGGVQAVKRHGIDEERLDRLIGRVNSVLEVGGEASAEQILQELSNEIDKLEDLDAFLTDLVPLARLAVFANGSPQEPEIDGRTARIPVLYLDEDFVERTTGEVKALRRRGAWKLDAIRG